MEYANKVITIYKIKGGKEMKKIIILIMHISIIMFLFTSCAKTNQFTKKFIRQMICKFKKSILKQEIDR